MRYQGSEGRKHIFKVENSVLLRINRVEHLPKRQKFFTVGSLLDILRQEIAPLTFSEISPAAEQGAVPLALHSDPFLLLC